MDVGVQVTVTDVIVEAAVTVTYAELDLIESCVEVAVTVSDPEAGTVAGAVYNPVLEIVPETADQVTVEL
jgi:oligoribonuclease (3'-5' exoribonuclease)